MSNHKGEKKGLRRVTSGGSPFNMSGRRNVRLEWYWYKPGHEDPNHVEVREGTTIYGMPSSREDDISFGHAVANYERG